MRFDKILYFRQLVLNKILSSNVFDYGDSKSESWHRAKKNSRSIYGQQIAPRTFYVIEIVFVLVGALKQ